MTIAIIDYGMGNLGSVRRALELIGAQPAIVQDPAALSDCRAAILPGVGAFADGMRNLSDRGWDQAIKSRVAEGLPILGICLGMQLLATTGDEGQECAGLGLVPGRVRHLADLGCRLRVPHVGWNAIAHVNREQDFLPSQLDGCDFYFVHSYVFCPENRDHVIASCNYGGEFPAVIGSGTVFGTQFHPEKSSKAGFEVLRSFLRLV